MAATAALDEASKQLLSSFLNVQRTRARLYAELQAGFKNLMGPKNEGMYRALLARVSTGFNDCSRQVIEMEARFNQDLGRPDLAALLRTVQENEREKLKCTMSLHALKGTFANGTFSWQQKKDSQSQRDDDDDYDPLDGPRQQQQQHHHHHHGAGGQCGCGAPPLEPTEEEYHGAVQEALVLQNAAIEAINEVLEEVTELAKGDDADDDAGGARTASVQ